MLTKQFSDEFAKEFFSRSLPLSPSAELSHLEPSMLHDIAPEDKFELPDDTIRTNGLSLDDLELNSGQRGKSKLQLLDDANAALREGNNQVTKFKRSKV